MIILSRKPTVAASVVLSDTILSVGTSSLDITNIPRGYKHLHLIATLRGTEASNRIVVKARYNNDAGSNYDSQFIFGEDVTSAVVALDAETETSLGECAGANTTAGSVGIIDALIADYASTTFHKMSVSKYSVIGRDASSEGGWVVGEVGGRWRDTSAITRITVFPLGGGDFVAGSRLTIYGLR